MLEELEKWSQFKQQVLPFDFWEEEKVERQKEIHQLLFFENPQNDNQQLFNLQKKYYEGDEKALTLIFFKLYEIAPKLVNKEMNNSRKKRTFTKEAKEEMSMDAVCLFIQQIKKNQLIIRDSFVAYLYLQVKKVMNTRTKAQMFEAYCRRNNINLFYQSEEEKAVVKLKFEKELRQENTQNEEGEN